MEAVEISGLWYIVRWSDAKTLDVIDGPYPEKWQAISMARLKEID